jgi:cbb3-type cytochrome oxidase maturation protein
MSTYMFLVPVALGLGLAGLGAFLWSLRNGQYEDLDGAAERILTDEDKPIRDRRGNGGNGPTSPLPLITTGITSIREPDEERQAASSPVQRSDGA